MVSFIESFKQGIDAATKIEQQKKEIEEVLGNLKRQILQATDRKIIIEVEDRVKYINNKKEEDSRSNLLVGGLSQATLNNILGVVNRGEEVRYRAIIAKTAALTPTNPIIKMELSKWSTGSEGGYPCKISYGKMESEAADRESLEEILKELISSARAGSIFKDLLASFGDEED